jgi:hypothetical protein
MHALSLGIRTPLHDRTLAATQNSDQNALPGKKVPG